MNERTLDERVGKATAMIPSGFRVAMLGSTAFHSAHGMVLTKLLGARLGGQAGVVLISGGMSGVAEVAAQSYARGREGTHLPRYAVQVLPEGVQSSFPGDVIHAGDSFEQRREILGRLADVYIVIEGGPGTMHEGTVAAGRGAVVLPVAVTGGAAAQLFAANCLTEVAKLPQWLVLNDRKARPPDVATAVMDILEIVRRSA